jgi:hypothetical protein
MSEFTGRIEDAIGKTAEALADGFDVPDLHVLVREAVECAEALDDLDGPAKRRCAIEFASELVDTFFTVSTPTIEKLVENVDWPLLPEAVERAVIDPWVRKLAVPYARDLIKTAIPYLVDLVVDATKGAVKVNEKEENA